MPVLKSHTEKASLYLLIVRVPFLHVCLGFLGFVLIAGMLEASSGGWTRLRSLWFTRHAQKEDIHEMRLHEMGYGNDEGTALEWLENWAVADAMPPTYSVV